MSNLGELKKLHDKGMALIYLHEKQKRPLESGWTSQNKKKWEELENSHEKRYNVGVRLGTPSLLISGLYLGAIDCDIKSSSRKAKTELNTALQKLGIDLKSAPIVMSGRGNGSKHVYVQTVKPMTPMKYAQSTILTRVLMPSVQPSKRDQEKLTEAEIKEGYRIRPAWEIAFMGTGQQTVLPPSIHPDTGAKYAWANGMQVKYLPTFDPSKFVSQVEKKEIDKRDLDFKPVKVDLWESKLSTRLIQMIEDGAGCEDRSASLFTITLTMCRLGFTDNEILTVLSDPEHWISEAAYEHTKSRNRGVAVKWLHKYTLEKARFETDIMRRFENKTVQKPLSDFESEKIKEEIQEKANQEIPDTDKGGKPKPTVRNVFHILEHFFESGSIGYDQFSNRAFFLKDTPYGGERGRELNDMDDLKLKHHIARHFRFEPSKECCYEAHALVAAQHAYHPVRTYLDSLEWDGESRLDMWLKLAFKAIGPKEYLSAISRKTLVAAVARIYEPGIKFDHVLILEGFQGKGKSTALRILAGDKWFTDGLGDIHQKDVVDQMTGKWIIELGELASIKKSDVEGVKAFLSRQTDRVRMPYGRRSADFPRQSIFIGSTNNDEYFIDETGNRRYWPVKILEADFKWLKTNRDQLWAEAVTMYNLGEELYLEKDLEKVAAQEQSKRYVTDEWESVVREYVEADARGDGKFSTTEIWCHVQNTPVGTAHPPDWDAKRVGKIMRRLDYVRTKVRIGGVQMKGWRKQWLEK